MEKEKERLTFLLIFISSPLGATSVLSTVFINPDIYRCLKSTRNRCQHLLKSHSTTATHVTTSSARTAEVQGNRQLFLIGHIYHWVLTLTRICLIRGTIISKLLAVPFCMIIESVPLTCKSSSATLEPEEKDKKGSSLQVSPLFWLVLSTSRMKQLEVSGGGGTPLFGLYRYVRPLRLRFFSRFGHK